MNEPSTQELLRMCLEGALPPGLAARADDPNDPLASRIRTCLQLAELLEDLPLESPPEALRDAARRVPRELHRSSLPVWIATLWSPPPSARPAFRGGAPPATTYEAGPFDVDLLQPADGTLVGQLLPRDAGTESPSAGSCTLFGEARTYHASLDANGGLRFTGVEAGEYKLVLDLDQGCVVVPDLLLH